MSRSLAFVFKINSFNLTLMLQLLGNGMQNIRICNPSVQLKADILISVLNMVRLLLLLIGMNK